MLVCASRWLPRTTRFTIHRGRAGRGGPPRREARIVPPAGCCRCRSGSETRSLPGGVALQAAPGRGVFLAAEPSGDTAYALSLPGLAEMEAAAIAEAGRRAVDPGAGASSAVLHPGASHRSSYHAGESAPAPAAAAPAVLVGRRPGFSITRQERGGRHRHRGAAPHGRPFGPGSRAPGRQRAPLGTGRGNGSDCPAAPADLLGGDAPQPLHQADHHGAPPYPLLDHLLAGLYLLCSPHSWPGGSGRAPKPTGRRTGTGRSQRWTPPARPSSPRSGRSPFGTRCARAPSGGCSPASPCHRWSPPPSSSTRWRSSP